MRYLLLIYEEPPATPPTPEESAAMMPESNAFTAWVQEQGWHRGGEALHDVDSATTVTVRDGRRIVTDGPFAEMACRRIRAPGSRRPLAAGRFDRIRRAQRDDPVLREYRFVDSTRADFLRPLGCWGEAADAERGGAGVPR